MLASLSKNLIALFALSALLCVALTRAQEVSEEFKESILEMHQKLRQRAELNGLTWNDDLAADARKYNEEKMAGEYNCKKLINSKRSSTYYRSLQQGENIWKRQSKTQRKDSVLAEMAVEYWYNQVMFYKWPGEDQPWGTCSPHTTEFSQLFWKSANQVGCHLAKCGQNRQVITCHYLPRTRTQKPMFKQVNMDKLREHEDIPDC